MLRGFAVSDGSNSNDGKQSSRKMETTHSSARMPRQFYQKRCSHPTSGPVDNGKGKTENGGGPVCGAVGKAGEESVTN